MESYSLTYHVSPAVPSPSAVTQVANQVPIVQVRIVQVFLHIQSTQPRYVMPAPLTIRPSDEKLRHSDLVQGKSLARNVSLILSS